MGVCVYFAVMPCLLVWLRVCDCFSVCVHVACLLICVCIVCLYVFWLIVHVWLCVCVFVGAAGYGVCDCCMCWACIVVMLVCAPLCGTAVARGVVCGCV